ncbi:hypothetical protein HMPREF1986_02048, partial [Oribacterium sp. oral taxon 078 str. F0263]
SSEGMRNHKNVSGCHKCPLRLSRRHEQEAERSAAGVRMAGRMAQAAKQRRHAES